MKIERWFKRASADRGKGHYQLVASSQVIELVTNSPINRIAKLERQLGITIDLIRDTSLHPEEFLVMDVKDETNITEKYRI